MSNITRRDPLDDFFRGFSCAGRIRWCNAEAPQMRVDVKGKQEDAFQVHAELPASRKKTSTSISTARWCPSAPSASRTRK